MKRFLFIITFCILGMTVVKGVGTDASVHKSGEIEIKCDYSCEQEVAVTTSVISDYIVIYVSSDWIVVHNTVDIEQYVKEYITYLAINDRFDDTFPEGY